MSNIEKLKEEFKSEGISDTTDLIKYDFTDYTACESYRKLEGLDRFFVYQLKDKNSWVMGNDGRMIYENAFHLRSQLCYNGMFKKDMTHPDSNCPLLQDIYKILWDDIYLKDCTSSGEIKGETMNSVNITLNALVAFDATEVQQFKAMNPSSSQNKSKLYIINRYYDPLDKKIYYGLNGNENLKNIVNAYHTLGNFIPFPVGCNSPRGYKNSIIEDYWDLTLLYIYRYYHCEIDALERIYKDDKPRKKFKSWLDKFGNWDTFVEKNYMFDFVNKNNEGEGEIYGKPITLWSEHFDRLEDDSYNPLPGPPKKRNRESNEYFEKATEYIEKCNEYFRNAAKCIEKRGKEMAEELFRRLNNQ